MKWRFIVDECFYPLEICTVGKYCYKLPGSWRMIDVQFLGYLEPRKRPNGFMFAAMLASFSMHAEFGHN